MEDHQCKTLENLAGRADLDIRYRDVNLHADDATSSLEHKSDTPIPTASVALLYSIHPQYMLGRWKRCYRVLLSTTP